MQFIYQHHIQKSLDKYFVVLEDIFNILSKHLHNKILKKILNGPKAITGLRLKMKTKIF